MALKLLRFDDPDTVNFGLNGGISGGRKVASPDGRILGLHNLTLVFNTPAGTLTFSDPTGVGLTAKDINDQLQAAVGLSGLVAQFYRGYLRIIEATPTNGVVLDAAGTANAVFGFGNKVDTTGIVYNPPTGVAPRYLDFDQNPQGDSILVMVETA